MITPLSSQKLTQLGRIAKAEAAKDGEVAEPAEASLAPLETAVLHTGGLPPLETPRSSIRTLVSGLGYVEFPQLAPDGKRLVFNVVGDYTTSQLMMVDPRGGKPHALDTGEKITPANVGEYLHDHEGKIREQATWTADGNLLYRTNEKGPFAIGIHDFQNDSDKVLVSDPNLNMKHPVELSDGHIVCYGGPPGEKYPTTDRYSNLFIADPADGHTRQLTDTRGEYAYKHPSEMKGQIVAHKEDKSRGGESDLITIDPVTGEEKPLTITPGADERHPFYNSQRDLLVYHRKVDGDKNLVLSTPDGSRTAQLTFYGHPAQSPCWSEDGKELYFVKKHEGPPEGAPFYQRQADIRAMDVKEALKELHTQAKERLKALEANGAERPVIDAAFEELENYEYFLRRY